MIQRVVLAVVFSSLAGTAFAQNLVPSPANDRAESTRMEIFARVDTWTGPDGEALPFQDEESILSFLEAAEIESEEPLSEGINKFSRLLLARDGVRMHAVFRDVRVRKDRAKMSDGRVVRNFRDDCVFEVAAYRLARLLGLHSVPPTVMRRINGRNGSVQVWIEDATTEGQRIKKSLSPPDDQDWLNQWQVIRLFDSLIYNDDRNPGNILIDRNWKLWMIDHTRAFREEKELMSDSGRIRYQVLKCERTVWENLKTLDRDTLTRTLGDVLEKRQILALLTRRDLLVEDLQQRIDQQGEAEVLF